MVSVLLALHKRFAPEAFLCEFFLYEVCSHAQTVPQQGSLFFNGMVPKDPILEQFMLSGLGLESEYGQARSLCMKKQTQSHHKKKDGLVLPESLLELEALLQKNFAFRNRFFSVGGECDHLQKVWPVAKKDRGTFKLLVDRSTALIQAYGAVALTKACGENNEESLLRHLKNEHSLVSRIMGALEIAATELEKLSPALKTLGLSLESSCHDLKMALIRQERSFISGWQFKLPYATLVEALERAVYLIGITQLSEKNDHILYVSDSNDAHGYYFA